jgi:alanine dehydrogenase
VALTIGVPKEHRPYEYRVGITPMGIALLVAKGHTCYVETGAGVGSGFSDVQYEQAGARIAYQKDEVFRRADLILKVQRPTGEEVEWMAGNQIIMALIMLGSAHENRVAALEAKGITAIAFELIEENGVLPVLYPLSQIGGRMTAQIAAQYLQNDKGGSGILLGGIASVPPAEVAIIGAGVVGMNAAQAFLGMGARVTLLDLDLHKLQAAHERFSCGITTMMPYQQNLEHICATSDVIVGAVQVPRQRAPQIITRNMVQMMHPGALIIDMSIDQGGCVETSRRTQHDQPTFVVDDVIHYCVTNVPGVVGRTATDAFLNSAWPYISLVVDSGIDAAIEQSPALRRGVIMHNGRRMSSEST